MRGSPFLPALVVGLALILAACGGTTASSAEPSQATESTAPAASESAAASEAAEPSEAAGCGGDRSPEPSSPSTRRS